MSREFWVPFAGSALLAVVLQLSFYTRDLEVDDNGEPVVKYLFAPWVSTAIAVFMAAVALYQWFDPINHHYRGNLHLLVGLPLGFSAASALFAIHTWSFRVSKKGAVVTLVSWPWSSKTYELAQLIDIAEIGKAVTLEFAEGQRITLSALHSGRKEFVARLRSQLQDRNR